MTTDLTWLPLSLRKNLPLPKVIIEPFADQPYGGYYCDNVIVAVESEDIAATLAHEFKHHVQHQNRYIPGSDWEQTSKGLSYNEGIRKYFRSYWWELDALLFQEKHASSEVGRFWLKGLVLPSSLDMNLEM